MTPTNTPSGHEDEQPRVVIRDRRRIDPVTGAPREVVDPAPDVESGAGAPPADARDTADAASPTGARTPGDSTTTDAPAADELAERTADLQRLSAEYANYRRRVERDRVAVVELAQDRVLAALLPVLDDIDRARAHGDLSGAFKAVADQLAAVLERNGLEPYGAPGDAFDPTQHEAVMHSTSPEVTGPTCIDVLRRGYRHGERVLRPAMVAVAEPGPGPEQDEGAGTGPAAHGVPEA